MMTAIRINNMGKGFQSRSAARQYAATEGGKVVDLAAKNPLFVETQIFCEQNNIPDSKLRWVVLFDRIICTSHISKLLSDTTKDFQQLGKTSVISKRNMLSLIAFGDRVTRHNKLLAS